LKGLERLLLRREFPDPRGVGAKVKNTLVPGSGIVIDFLDHRPDFYAICRPELTVPKNGIGGSGDDLTEIVSLLFKATAVFVIAL
jgi:hypothetical protein